MDVRLGQRRCLVVTSPSHPWLYRHRLRCRRPTTIITNISRYIRDNIRAAAIFQSPLSLRGQGSSARRCRGRGMLRARVQASPPGLSNAQTSTNSELTARERYAEVWMQRYLENHPDQTREHAERMYSEAQRIEQPLGLPHPARSISTGQPPELRAPLPQRRRALTVDLLLIQPRRVNLVPLPPVTTLPLPQPTRNVQPLRTSNPTLDSLRMPPPLRPVLNARPGTSVPQNCPLSHHLHPIHNQYSGQQPFRQPNGQQPPTQLPGGRQTDVQQPFDSQTPRERPDLQQARIRQPLDWHLLCCCNIPQCSCINSPSLGPPARSPHAEQHYVQEQPIQSPQYPQLTIHLRRLQTPQHSSPTA